MASFDHAPTAFILITTLLAAACSTSDRDLTGSQKASVHGDAATAEPDAGQADVTGDDTAKALRRWVGDVSDSDARVGVVADAAHARLFFCGGAESYATATRWFSLDIQDGALEFADDSWHVSARIEADRVTGDVDHGGVTHAFSAELAAQDTLAGLYEGQADCGRLGLIVQQSTKTDSVHAQGACVGAGHDPEQVNPILPVALSMGEIAVEAPGQAGAQVGLHALQSP